MDILNPIESLRKILSEPPSANEEGKGILGNVNKAIKELEGGTRRINYLFGLTRQRVEEVKIAIADTTPFVDRLGGNMEQAIQGLEAVATATRRNVIASTDDISKLIAANGILGRSVDSMVEDFQGIGVQFSMIGPELESAIGYVKNVGANLVQVMDTVFQYMGNMNKFNFQNGVEGFTRMATKATILKFDMQQVFNLAEDALKPERAVELASAFQRLGVSVGTLTDPFDLMYKSLMDPEGLQDALVEMTAQYSEFNEKTKRFEITPYGKLMLREIGREAGIAGDELMKLSLNTADLQRRMGMIKPDFQFESEEDKMLLANMARMKTDGRYVIDIMNKETGKKEEVDLQKLSNEQMETLIELQKSGPKTLEDIQRAQLETENLMKGDVRAIKDRMYLGTASAPDVIKLMEEIRRGGVGVTQTLVDKSPDTQKVRDETQNAVKGISDFAKGAMTGNVEELGKLTTQFNQLIDKVKGMGGDSGVAALPELTKLGEKLKEYAGEIGKAMDTQPRISGKEMTPELMRKQQDMRRAAREFDRIQSQISQISNQSLTQYYTNNIQGRQFSSQDFTPRKIDVNVTGGQITKIELTGSPELVKLLSNMPEVDRKKFVAQFDEELFKIIKQGVNKVDGDYMPKK